MLSCLGYAILRNEQICKSAPWIQVWRMSGYEFSDGYSEGEKSNK